MIMPLVNVYSQILKPWPSRKFVDLAIDFFLAIDKWDKYMRHGYVHQTIAYSKNQQTNSKNGVQMQKKWKKRDKQIIQLNPSENISQLGSLFPIYGKIKAMFQTTNQ